MILTNVYLQSTAGTDVVLTADSEATPVNVVAWLHMMIASKTFRALVSLHKASHGEPWFCDDANATAKLVLTSIDRSRAAFEEMEKVDPSDARVANLGDYLGMMSAAMEKRFPEARAFVRPGLDEAE